MDLKTDILDDYCRTCVAEINVEKYKVNELPDSFQQLLKFCLETNQLFDSSPDCICQLCYESLKNVDEYRNQIKQATAKLLQLRSNQCFEEIYEGGQVKFFFIIKKLTLVNSRMRLRSLQVCVKLEFPLDWVNMGADYAIKIGERKKSKNEETDACNYSDNAEDDADWQKDKSVDLNMLENQLKCSVCHRKFHDKSTLKVHIRLRDSKLPYQ